jgi:hypothetical protein
VWQFLGDEHGARSLVDQRVRQRQVLMGLHKAGVEIIIIVVVFVAVVPAVAVGAGRRQHKTKGDIFSIDEVAVFAWW